MGWTHETDDVWHEAFLAPEFSDGSRGIGMSTGKVSAGEVIVGVEYIGVPGNITREAYDTRPVATAIGWRILCTCASHGDLRSSTQWVSDLLPRVVSVALEDLESGRFFSSDEDVAWLADVERYETAARAIWSRAHLAPVASLAAVAQARRAVLEAEQSLNSAVATAREAGHSWEVIGRAAGVTRQSAHSRWS